MKPINANILLISLKPHDVYIDELGSKRFDASSIFYSLEN